MWDAVRSPRCAHDCEIDVGETAREEERRDVRSRTVPVESDGERVAHQRCAHMRGVPTDSGVCGAAHRPADQEARAVVGVRDDDVIKLGTGGEIDFDRPGYKRFAVTDVPFDDGRARAGADADDGVREDGVGNAGLRRPEQLQRRGERNTARYFDVRSAILESGRESDETIVVDADETPMRRGDLGGTYALRVGESE